MKKLVILFVMLFAITACETMDGGMEATPETNEAAAALIKDATDANKKAAKMGSLWRDANKMIKKAKAALEKGDIKKAIKLAKAAKEQGRLGQVQASDQKNAAPWLF